MDGWIIIGAIIALCVTAAFAYKFAMLAEEKGYSAAPYFWLCFLFGVIGYCMVAALPDQVLRSRLRELGELEKKQQSPIFTSGTRTAARAGTSAAAGAWTCTCGKVNVAYVSSCTCGKSKREVLNKN